MLNPEGHNPDFEPGSDFPAIPPASYETPYLQGAGDLGGEVNGQAATEDTPQPVNVWGGDVPGATPEETGGFAEIEAHIDTLLAQPDTPMSVLAEALVTGENMHSGHAREILNRALSDEQQAIKQEIARRQEAAPDMYPYVEPKFLEEVAKAYEKAYKTSGDSWDDGAQNRIAQYAPDPAMAWKLHMRHLDRLVSAGSPEAAEELAQNALTLASRPFNPHFNFTETRYACSRIPDPEMRTVLVEKFLYEHTLHVPWTLDTFNEFIEVGKMVLDDPEIIEQEYLVDTIAMVAKDWAQHLQGGETDVLQVAAKMLSWNRSLAEFRRTHPS